MKEWLLDSFCRVPGRSILRVSGPDSVKFLQGLTTNQMTRIERGGDGMYTGFLNAQGRLLSDAFIYPENKGTEFPKPSFLVEFDQSCNLGQHFSKYRLRSRVEIEPVQSSVWQTWGPASLKNWKDTGLIKGTLVPRPFMDVAARDPRHPSLGVRFISDSVDMPSTFTLRDYNLLKVLRYSLGIAEGGEYPPACLPLEANFDYINGVDFRKGCYLGQELTIRTYHTGVVRKRIVPLMLFSGKEPDLEIDPYCEFKVPPQTELKDRIGKFCASQGNVGIALVRLESVGSIIDLGNSVYAKAFIPKWWPV